MVMAPLNVNETVRSADIMNNELKFIQVHMEKKDYSDIITLEHHISSNRKHLSMAQRAAQFAPFAGLPGIKEDNNDTPN